MTASPYPSRRVPVDRRRSLPGAPRERRSQPLTDMDVSRLRDRQDSEQRAGVNAGAASVWAPYYPGVTSRKALKRPSWSSGIAGGARIVDPRV